MYDYYCRTCGRTIELSNVPNVPVPCTCGKTMIRKYYAAPVHFRGSGFYATDKLLTPVKPEDYDPEID
jgi:predicted nucleic acid-binding Zn ribbon protein